MISINGKEMRTASDVVLTLPNIEISHAIAAESRSGGGPVFNSRIAPLTWLAAKALDCPPGILEDELVAWGNSDLVCYRTENPAELAELQYQRWQPLVDWIALHHDMPLKLTRGILPIEQPAAVERSVRKVIEGCDKFCTAALHTVAAQTRSMVIGAAVVSGQINATTAYKSAMLEELYSLEVWGEDPQARKRLDHVRDLLMATERFLSLLR